MAFILNNYIMKNISLRCKIDELIRDSYRHKRGIEADRDSGKRDRKIGSRMVEFV